MKERQDDFLDRSKHLKNMTDQELKNYFFELLNQTVNPLIDIAYKNTSKSIERSVLLRMGFSSLQAKEIVDILYDENLLMKGAGHCVYRVHKTKDVSIIEAGKMIINKDAINLLKEAFDHHG